MKCPYCEKETDCDCFTQVYKASLNNVIERAEKAESELAEAKETIKTLKELLELSRKTIGGVK
jgi:hypothetical protein